MTWLPSLPFGGVVNYSLVCANHWKNMLSLKKEITAYIYTYMCTFACLANASFVFFFLICPDLPRSWKVQHISFRYKSYCYLW
jgi:hypothetical protein